MKTAFIYFVCAMAGFFLTSAFRSLAHNTDQSKKTFTTTRNTFPDTLSPTIPDLDSPQPISLESLFAALNHAANSDHDSELLKHFESLHQHDPQKAINWLSAHQSFISKHPELLRVLTSSIQDPAQLAALQKNFLPQNHSAIAASFLDTYQGPDIELACFQLLENAHPQAKPSTLIEVGKHRGLQALESFFSLDYGSSDDRSLLAVGIAQSLPAAGIGNRLEWAASLDDSSLHGDMILQQAIQQNLREDEIENTLSFLDALIDSDPERGIAILQKTGRSLVSTDPLQSLDLLSRHGNPAQFEQALNYAFDLAPQQANEWLHRANNRELAIPFLDTLAHTVSASRGTEAFELLSYSEPEQRNKVVRSILFRLARNNHDRSSAIDAIVSCNLLDPIQKQKAISYWESASSIPFPKP